MEDIRINQEMLVHTYTLNRGRSFMASYGCDRISQLQRPDLHCRKMRLVFALLAQSLEAIGDRRGLEDFVIVERPWSILHRVPRSPLATRQAVRFRAGRTLTLKYRVEESKNRQRHCIYNKASLVDAACVAFKYYIP